MQKRKNKKILIYIFLFLIFGTLNNKNLSNINFAKIKSITVTGLDEKNNYKLMNSLNFLKIDNLFFLNKYQIEKIIESNNLVEKYFVSKKYPSTLNVKVDKTKILVRFKKNEKLFFLGSNGKLIEEFDNINNVPFIFGEFKNQNFFELKNKIDESKFNFSEIKNLFSFKSGRWDIETKEGILIKLPKNNLKESFELLVSILAENKEQKILKIDLRQHNQVIIDG